MYTAFFTKSIMTVLLFQPDCGEAFTDVSVTKVYQPRLTIWVSQELFPTSQGDGGFPKGNLTIPKEVNRKKNNETEAAFLTPANGYGYHFIEINYLYPF
ncbi:neuronal regeneration-related protein [Terrapene carolina triunguis]|uniref:neuronal regeneration-related protein n=1 Tax=Terrapene triunguis TaxID=2587831 RepID=UPI0011566974|nr:neuronal regeneration-related protein [Terrapene carolina triunguis]